MTSYLPTSRAALGYLFKVCDLRLSRLEKMLQRKPRLRIVSAEPREPSPTTRPSTGPTKSPNTAASTRPVPTAVIPEEQFDEKLDRPRQDRQGVGEAALSDDENRVLEEASRRALGNRAERADLMAFRRSAKPAPTISMSSSTSTPGSPRRPRETTRSGASLLRVSRRRARRSRPAPLLGRRGRRRRRRIRRTPDHRSGGRDPRVERLA